MNNTTRILIVDDEPDMLRSLRRILRMRGYEVETASSGEEAVQAANRFAPHGVLMDMRMQGIDGVEASRRIRVERPDTFVCFMTAYSDLAAQAEEEGASVLTKPLDIELLCDFVADQAAHSPVLIVDDDQQFSTSLRRVLGEAGFVTDVAESVSQAKEYFARRGHAIVLLDIQLGSASGWDLLPELRGLNPNVCVVAISGVANASDRDDLGDYVFLPKPLDLDRLISTLQNSLTDE